MLGLNEKSDGNIQKLAINLAGEAGAILGEYFGKPLSVKYKDESELDPVTNIDNQIQEHIQDSVKSHFPNHGFLGEEDVSEPLPTNLIPEFLWVVDPIDGTKNFIAGLPVYACSIAVLYKGAPYIGAVFLPWPNSAGGSVLHAKTGSGAFFNDEKISIRRDEEMKTSALITLPGSFSNIFKATEILKSKIGDFRMTGSIAYEMSMSALGISQLMVTTAPKIWDVAAGVCIIIESGGLVLEGVSRKKRFGIFNDFKWNPLTTFSEPEHIDEMLAPNSLRKWQKPLIAGSPHSVQFTASNLEKR